MDSGFLISVLTSIGFQLPWLIASVVVLALLVGAPGRGAPRRNGIIAAAMLCGTQGAHLLIAIYQSWLITDVGFRSDSTASLSLQMQVMSAIGFILGCVSAVALVMLAMALAKSIRQATAPPPLPLP